MSGTPQNPFTTAPAGTTQSTAPAANNQQPAGEGITLTKDQVADLLENQKKYQAIMESLSQRLQTAEDNLIAVQRTAMGSSNMMSEGFEVKLGEVIGKHVANAINPGMIVPTKSTPVNPDDYMEVPIIFFAYRAFHVIAGDTRMGTEVCIPNDVQMIKFRNVAFVREDKKNLMAVCQYDCHSKSIAKWLKEHTQYGTQFFSQDAVSLISTGNAEYSSELSATEMMLRSWQPGQIAAECSRRGIAVSSDPASMINQLAIAIATEKFHKHPDGSYERLEVYNSRVSFDTTAEGVLKKYNEKLPAPGEA